jgi:hypothetical protein
MTNDLTPQEPPAIEDDGFHGSFDSGRIIKGSSLKWTDTTHWLDRDGLVPPSPLLVVAINELLQKWKNGKAETIVTKPLPDPKALNDAIPVSEWEVGKDKKAVPPWQHTIAVYFVNVSTGEFYTYAAATVGAHIAFDHLREAVVTMRLLRGTRCMPLVKLAERPFKTKHGMRRRPHFDVAGWKTPGDDAKAVPAKQTPQLTGPTAATASASEATSVAPAAAPPTAPSTPPRQPKPSIALGTETLATMGDVKPATTSEILNDELPW